MSVALLPGLLVVALATSIAVRRTYELTWRAPVAAAPLTAALQAKIARAELGAAISLCRALSPAWAAACAAQCLRASEERSPLAGVVEELRVTYAQRASRGVEALRALGRMSFPLALGSAILAMSSAAAAADVTQVEQALSIALQAMIVGLTTVVFCRMSAIVLSRQGALRMREIAVVCRGTVRALEEGACSPPLQT